MAPVPNHQALAAALGRSEPLQGLLQRLHESQARLASVSPLLPPGLRAGLRAGPLDDTAWVLLAGDAAAAAKLRQMLPALQEQLRAAGWADKLLRVKVQPRQPL